MRRPVGTAVLHRTLLLGGIWAVLTAADPKGLAVAAVAVPATVWLSLRLLPARHPLRLWPLLRHIPWFLLGSLRGGLDVARRALAPRLNLRPGWREVPLSLPDGARAAMGVELSLMPGTLAAGSRDGRLLVHLLDLDAGFERGIPAEEAAFAAMLDGATRPEGGTG